MESNVLFLDYFLYHVLVSRIHSFGNRITLFTNLHDPYHNRNLPRTVRCNDTNLQRRSQSLMYPVPRDLPLDRQTHFDRGSSTKHDSSEKKAKRLNVGSRWIRRSTRQQTTRHVPIEWSAIQAALRSPRRSMSFIRFLKGHIDKERTYTHEEFIWRIFHVHPGTLFRVVAIKQK